MAEIDQCRMIIAVGREPPDRIRSGLAIEKYTGLLDLLGLRKTAERQAVSRDDARATARRVGLDTFEAGGEGFARVSDQAPLIRSRACVLVVVVSRRDVAPVPSGASKASRNGLRALRMIRVSMVRRGRETSTPGPPIAGSSSPLTASIASRISSASSRWTVRFQSKRFSGSTRWPAARSTSRPTRRLAVGG